jgi:hypothetical protein
MEHTLNNPSIYNTLHGLTLYLLYLGTRPPYYWGTELYPRIFGFDVKVFTNCRFGMMIWAVLVYIDALKSDRISNYYRKSKVAAYIHAAPDFDYR